jgi:hypothetical protein
MAIRECGCAHRQDGSGGAHQFGEFGHYSLPTGSDRNSFLMGASILANQETPCIRLQSNGHLDHKARKKWGDWQKPKMLHLRSYLNGIRVKKELAQIIESDLHLLHAFARKATSWPKFSSRISTNAGAALLESRTST